MWAIIAGEAGETNLQVVFPMFNVCIKVCMVNSQPCPGVGKTALVVVAVQVTPNWRNTVN
jgi:hypothetical protein